MEEKHWGEKNKKKQRLKKGELVRMILDKIADELIDFGYPYPRGRGNVILGHLIKLVLAKFDNKVKATNIRKAVWRLKKRQILQVEGKGDQSVIGVTKKGKVKLLERSLKKILDFKKKEKKWDGKWFMVFFDVPEKQRKNRDYLRFLLKEIGFFQYQKSVYIFPYECQKEVKYFKKIVEGGEYINYVVAERIENEEKFIKFFKLV